MHEQINESTNNIFSMTKVRNSEECPLNGNKESDKYLSIAERGKSFERLVLRSYWARFTLMRPVLVGCLFPPRNMIYVC